jgi:hypothetical protein
MRLSSATHSPQIQVHFDSCLLGPGPQTTNITWRRLFDAATERDGMPRAQRGYVTNSIITTTQFRSVLLRTLRLLQRESWHILFFCLCIAEAAWNLLPATIRGMKAVMIHHPSSLTTEVSLPNSPPLSLASTPSVPEFPAEKNGSKKDLSFPRCEKKEHPVLKRYAPTHLHK